MWGDFIRSSSHIFTARLYDGRLSDTYTTVSEVIVYDPSDVKCRTRFKSEDFPKELIGLFGIRLYALCVRIEPVAGIQRVFQEFFELVNGANPILHLIRGNGFRSLADFGNKLFFPFFLFCSYTVSRKDG